MYFNKKVELACCSSIANTAWCNYLYLLKNVKSLESVVIDWLQ